MASTPLRMGADDEVLLLKAAELNRVLLTRDVDLEVIAHRWLYEWRPFRGVIFWRQEPSREKSTLGEVVEAIEAFAETKDPFAYPGRRPSATGSWGWRASAGDAVASSKRRRRGERYPYPP